eukprot:NODE_5465_length_579_cov_302.417939.p3 GENE.NODE_5465_length_579_cov_302.417939~~NODE_5465_length_579_cov_302.417939.p3  ORF type:complete len:160 (+),score=16.27 NODE_5465_length_579_cov_302.417939:3-482(+)
MGKSQMTWPWRSDRPRYWVRLRHNGARIHLGYTLTNAGATALYLRAVKLIAEDPELFQPRRQAELRTRAWEGVKECESPCAVKTEPCSRKGKQCGRKSNPYSRKGKQCGRKSKPCSRKGKQCGRKSEPCSRKRKLCGRKSEPCSRKRKPAARCARTVKT